MKAKLDFRAMSITLFIALVFSYVVCITSDLLFGWTMYQVWMPIIPGFIWPVTLSGFLVGLFWIVIYSLYGTAIIVLPYNLLVSRRSITG